jgi:hypothetical protein
MGARITELQKWRPGLGGLQEHRSGRNDASGKQSEKFASVGIDPRRFAYMKVGIGVAKVPLSPLLPFLICCA